MARPLTGTLVKVDRHPGIYRRHTKDCDSAARCRCPFVVIYRGADGRQQRETYRTLSEAREGKALAARKVALAKAHARGLHRGSSEGECPECERERQLRDRSEPTLHEYARAWIDRYQGTGRRGFRQETRDESRRLLEHFALRYFPEPTRLVDIGPREIAEFIGWLVQQPSRRGGTLSDSSVHNACKPLFSCLATARREGVIEHNPAMGATLPHRPQIEEDEDRPRPFPGETMELVVALVHPAHRLMFELLAATGLRRSELFALEGRHLALDGDQPHIKVRQRVRRQRGNGLVVGPLKSRHARRDLPIGLDLADRLRALRVAPDAPVFASRVGTVLDPDNLADRVLAPACGEAGVGWAGFHTFRHTVASRLFDSGRNVVAVQRWLGHHSPSFTLDTYVHLLDGDLGEPLLSTVFAQAANGMIAHALG